MKKYIGFIILIIGIIIDQITKAFALNLTQSVECIPNVLNFTLVKNTGVAFGLGQGGNTIFIFLTIFIIIFMLAIMIASYKKEGTCNWGLFMILSGAIGNLIDRIFRGFVVDFIDTPYIATFNIADSLIVIGAFSVIIEELCKEIFPKYIK